MVPPPRILLFGDDAGVAEAASAHGVEHAPNIRRNDAGTPYVSDAFNMAPSRAGRDALLCYVNADIMFPSDLGRVAEIAATAFPRFLLVGRRWDVDLLGEWDFSPGWQTRLSTWAQGQGRLHDAAGIDYFIYPAEIDWKMPDFLVGRPGWDNWLLHAAWRRSIPIVDATNAICAVHQNHEYGSVDQVVSADEIWTGPEAQRNRRAAKGRRLTIADADYRLDSGDVVPLSRSREERVERWVRGHPGVRGTVRMALRCRNIIAGASRRFLRLMTRALNKLPGNSGRHS